MKNKLDNLELKNSLLDFLTWFESNGFDTYDNNDIWASKIGNKVKSIYIKKPKIGLIPLAIIHLMDVFIPSVRILLSNKKAFSCAKAEMMMGYINLEKIFSNNDYRKNVITISRDLINISNKTNNGIGWGVPYKWVTPDGDLPLNSPSIVQTSHCFHAFDKIFLETKDEKYLEIIQKITNFVYEDLKININNSKSEPSKYGYNFPVLTFNTIAIRASILMRAYKLFEDEKYKNASMKNINYLADYQNDDGSWFYSHDLDSIDNFHTCYILKSLYSAYRSCNDNLIIDIANKGYDYYKNNFIRPDGTLIHCTKNTNPKFRYIELLDYAEAIKLEIEIKKATNKNLLFASDLVNQVVHKFQTKKGYFITRINSLGMKNKIPYLRWPQAPLFNALTEYYIYS